jgi:hypothetical protein
LGLGSLVGLALTGAVYVITIAQMAGSDVASLDRSLMITMLTGTALGWSILARTLALLAMPLLLPGWLLGTRLLWQDWAPLPWQVWHGVGMPQRHRILRRSSVSAPMFSICGRG